MKQMCLPKEKPSWKTWLELNQKGAKRVLKGTSKAAIVNVRGVRRNIVNASYKESYAQIYVSVRGAKTVNKNQPLQHYLKTVEITSWT